MSFATRSDLLARSNARRLAQLAVPADVAMPPDDAFRIAIGGGDLADLAPAHRASLTLALDAVDKALADADELIVSHGIAATAQSTLLARLASTIALYFLQGAERMTDDVRKAYEGAVATLKSHARGEISLLQITPSVPPLTDDQVFMGSDARRYGSAVPQDGW